MVFIFQYFKNLILIICLKKSKEKGAVVIKDIWEESDEYGKVRMATIKTVYNYKSY